MRAKKSLGQHFLKSERALAAIIEAGDVDAKDTILEIGPGTGTLTDKLLEARGLVLAIEKDDKLYEMLKTKYDKEIATGQLILMHGDILNFEFKNYNLVPGHYKLISNIPYNITGMIFKKFLGGDRQPEKMVLLVQKEVAERILGNRGRQASIVKESVLSISVKVYGTPRYVETVKAGSFAPMPSVDSAIIAVENISKEFFKQFSEKAFFEMLRAGFKSKRKKLSSNLSVIFEKNEVLETFRKLSLDENLRAEDVKVETWHKLAQNLLNE